MSDEVASGCYDFRQHQADLEVPAVPGGDDVLAVANTNRDAIAHETGFEVELVLAERRFDWISRLVAATTG